MAYEKVENGHSGRARRQHFHNNATVRNGRFAVYSLFQQPNRFSIINWCQLAFGASIINQITSVKLSNMGLRCANYPSSKDAQLIVIACTFGHQIAIFRSTQSPKIIAEELSFPYQSIIKALS